MRRLIYYMRPSYDKCTASMSVQAPAAEAASAGQPPPPLVVVGSVNADLVLQVERLPKDGETLGAQSLNTFPGGKVAAAMRAFWSSVEAQILHG
jgi:hypothetical protein